MNNFQVVDNNDSTCSIIPTDCRVPRVLLLALSSLIIQIIQKVCQASDEESNLGTSYSVMNVCLNSFLVRYFIYLFFLLSFSFSVHMSTISRRAFWILMNMSRASDLVWHLFQVWNVIRIFFWSPLPFSLCHYFRKTRKKEKTRLVQFYLVHVKASQAADW